MTNLIIFDFKSALGHPTQSTTEGLLENQVWGTNVSGSSFLSLHPSSRGLVGSGEWQHPSLQRLGL